MIRCIVRSHANFCTIGLCQDLSECEAARAPSQLPLMGRESKREISIVHYALCAARKRRHEQPHQTRRYPLHAAESTPFITGRNRFARRERVVWTESPESRDFGGFDPRDRSLR